MVFAVAVGTIVAASHAAIAVGATAVPVAAAGCPAALPAQPEMKTHRKTRLSSVLVGLDGVRLGNESSFSLVLNFSQIAQENRVSAVKSCFAYYTCP